LTAIPTLDALAKLGFNYLMTDDPQFAVDAVPDAQDAGLGLLLRLSLDEPTAEAPLRSAQPGWFVQPNDADADLPDPRHVGRKKQVPRLRLEDPTVAESAQRAWADQLKTMAGKNVSGFCLALGGSAAAEFFTSVISSVKSAFPDCKFLAWTLGVSAERAAPLTACGFDGAFTSSAWWDFRSPWLQQEHERLRPFGSLIAVAAKPTTPTEKADPADARGLALAALIADGLLASGDFLNVCNRDVLKTVLLQMAEDSMNVAADHAADLQMLSAPGAPVAVLLAGKSEGDSAQRLLVVNTTDEVSSIVPNALLARVDGLAVAAAGGLSQGDDGAALNLQPREFRLLETTRNAVIATAGREAKGSVEKAVRKASKRSRVSIEAISPSVDGGLFVVKRRVGDTVVVEADIFGEGHDMLAACIQWRAVDEQEWHETPLRSVVNDRWRGEFPLARIGQFQYQIEAWIDTFGAWRDEVEKKIAAGQQVALELREGHLLVEAALARVKENGRTELASMLASTQKAVKAAKGEAGKVALMLAPTLQRAMAKADDRVFNARSNTIEVDSERRAAGFSSWYELFPRSMGPDAATHGTFLDVLPRLPAIRAMGFDTLYLLPIHPIGQQHRKGPNNSLTAGPNDPGSPYAIGAVDGGHEAIHRELGTFDDFGVLVRAAKEHGLEIALDFAVQCSPDHPWLKEHPDWFSWRPDGTIRYAENPPKKYQDIVNVDFYADGAVPQLWLALRNVVLFWVKEGVKVFRVDNPHTKPMPFWEWLIGDVRARHPDVIFLAEAFTRPKPMYRLAKVGFSQSYTYFTWRHTKREFIDYLTELTQEAPRDFFRPHFFVNTPDINPYFLQRSGRAGFVIRAALATTLSGLWGMYSGFELCEAEPVPGKEEYLDSEKYQLRQRDWAQPGNIVREITLLNHIRRHNPALQTHLGVRFCESSGEDILCFTKTSPGNVLFIAICLDPHGAHECAVELPLQDWNLPEDARLDFEDLAHGNNFSLKGRHQRLQLDPCNLAFTIWRLQGPGAI
jgi:starch synthase (maltosyl-transferring)